MMNNNGHWFMQLFVRTGMFLFWAMVIVLFLSLSHFELLFQDKKSINIFTWPLVIDPEDVLKKFTAETGIRVYVSYYETNEELFGKLRVTGGAGYDMVVPSDYLVPLLIKEGLLKKIDKSQLPCFEKIDPKLLNHYYDPHNLYTVPYVWITYGLGVDQRYFKDKELIPSWAMIFDPAVAPPSVGMINAPREAILIAAQYLFGKTDNLLAPGRIEKIKELLLTQKSMVETYTEMGIEYLLLSGSAPVVVAEAQDVVRIKHFADFVDFVLPQEGGFVLMDLFALPAKTKKDAMVYQLINFLYRNDILIVHRDKYGMCPPTIELQQQESDVFCPTEEQFSKMEFFKSDLSEETFFDIWLTLMAL